MNASSNSNGFHISCVICFFALLIASHHLFYSVADGSYIYISFSPILRNTSTPYYIHTMITNSHTHTLQLKCSVQHSAWQHFHSCHVDLCLRDPACFCWSVVSWLRPPLWLGVMKIEAHSEVEMRHPVKQLLLPLLVFVALRMFPISGRSQHCSHAQLCRLGNELASPSGESWPPPHRMGAKVTPRGRLKWKLSSGSTVLRCSLCMRYSATLIPFWYLFGFQTRVQSRT